MRFIQSVAFCCLVSFQDLFVFCAKPVHVQSPQHFPYTKLQALNSVLVNTVGGGPEINFASKKASSTVT